VAVVSVRFVAAEVVATGGAWFGVWTSAEVVMTARDAVAAMTGMR